MSSSSTLSAYKHLISLFSSTPPIVLEIEILPSSISSTILHSGQCVGIPKSLLISCFLHARSILFSHIASASVNDANRNGSGIVTTQSEALDATLVILLFDAGYTTAVNFRKRRLMGLKEACVSTLCEEKEGHEPNTDKWKELEDAVTRELTWIESLVTSPLYKHAKSSTLWAHRLWLLKEVHMEMGNGFDEDNVRRMVAFVNMELEIVMRAGERHAGNYHAWNYARDVVRLVMAGVEGEALGGEGPKVMMGIRVSEISQATTLWIGKVKDWCLGHPRDVSGWSFLVFLLGQVPRPATHQKAVVGEVIQKTEKFVEQVGWQGESIEWFLRSARQVQIDRSR
ncbi:MAG: hypothetical protein L6R39_003457 [Caloplaca ligustica]|nr:MAG: hypothetical protein L6R39_003457 [Caloplaca ligustica]